MGQKSVPTIVEACTRVAQNKRNLIAHNKYGNDKNSLPTRDIERTKRKNINEEIIGKRIMIRFGQGFAFVQLSFAN
jgi:hypothetical protein